MWLTLVDQSEPPVAELYIKVGKDGVLVDDGSDRCDAKWFTEVDVPQKSDTGDRGAVTQVNESRLDTKSVDSVLGQFYDVYEDR